MAEMDPLAIALQEVMEAATERAVSHIEEAAKRVGEELRALAAHISAGLATDGKLPAIDIYRNGGAIRVIEVKAYEGGPYLNFNALKGDERRQVTFPELRLPESGKLRLTIIAEPLD